MGGSARAEPPRQQEIINRTENAKRNRLDPAKADWKVAYSASLQQQKTYIRVDDNGDNIYINEDGNVMALIATSNEGKFYNKYGEIKKHDANEYLVFVEEIDLKNDRQRLVDCYKYYADAKAKGLLDYDWRELGGGNWEKMINTIPNYYDWLRKNYDSFYKLGT